MPLVRSVPGFPVIRAMRPMPRPPIFVGAEIGKDGSMVYSPEPVEIPAAEWDRYYERAVRAGHLELVSAVPAPPKES
jgi:hypothetical protein